MIKLGKVISTLVENAIRKTKFTGMGKRDTQEHRVAGPVGEDSAPIEGMVAIVADTKVNGETVVLGYLNKNHLSTVLPGEKRIYSTDEDGVEQIFIKLTNAGEIHLGAADDNLVRYSVLKTELDTLKTELNQLRDFYNAHTHLGNSGFPTGIPSNGWAGTGLDISSAKIDEVKCS